MKHKNRNDKNEEAVSLEKAEDLKEGLAKPEGDPKEAEVQKAVEPITLSKQEYDALLAKVAELESQKDQFLRKAADYDNAKKRLERDKEDFLKFANERLIRELLPVLDNLNRAIEQAEKTKPDDSILKGIHLIEKHVFDVLKKYGLSRIEAMGANFSTEFHEALGEVETSEKPESSVVEVLEDGYLLQGKLLRPARVKIAKAPAASSDVLPEESDA